MSDFVIELTKDAVSTPHGHSKAIDAWARCARGSITKRLDACVALLNSYDVEFLFENRAATADELVACATALYPGQGAEGISSRVAAVYLIWASAHRIACDVPARQFFLWRDYDERSQSGAVDPQAVISRLANVSSAETLVELSGLLSGTPGEGVWDEAQRHAR